MKNKKNFNDNNFFLSKSKKFKENQKKLQNIYWIMIHNYVSGSDNDHEIPTGDILENRLRNLASIWRRIWRWKSFWMVVWSSIALNLYSRWIGTTFRWRSVCFIPLRPISLIQVFNYNEEPNQATKVMDSPVPKAVS